MKILKTGTLSGTTGGNLGSGVSTPPIDLSLDRNLADVGIWIAISGDLGRTGGSVAVICKGSYSKEGTYATDNDEALVIVKSGTSKAGLFSNGSYLKAVSFPMPFMRLEGVASKSGSTQHGSSTTNSVQVAWAVTAP